MAAMDNHPEPTAASATASPSDGASSGVRSRSRRARRRRQPSRQNFWLHLLGGGGLLMAMQFGNPRLVLPWISQNLGVAYILIAMLVPLFQGGLVLSQLTAAPLIGRFSLRKRLVTGMGLMLGGLFAVIFVAAAGLSPAIAAVALLVCAAAVGVTFGIFTIGNSDLLAKTVPRRMQGKVLAQRVAFGGLMTLAATFAVWALLPNLAGNHLILLWLAVGAWIGAAAAYGMVNELPSELVEVAASRLNLRHARSLLAQYPWYRRLQVTSMLLQSVEMAVPFYAVHAATLHDPTASNLSAFVVAMALGLVLSGPIWGRLLDRHNALVAVAGCLIAAAAGALVLIMDQMGDPTVPFYHAFLFLPLSLARQGVIQARMRYLSVKAPAGERPAMIALNNAALASAGIVVALILGAAGHLHDIRTPLVLLILANVATALYARRALAD